MSIFREIIIDNHDIKIKPVDTWIGGGKYEIVFEKGSLSTGSLVNEQTISYPFIVNFLYRDMYLRPELYEAKKEAVYWLICDLITDVGNGKNYKEALDEAYTRIYQSVDNAYTENAEYASDKIYWDVPPADFVMFTQARKFLLEAIPKTK